MPIKQDLQRSAITSALIELFAIDLTPCGLAQVFYFTPNSGSGSIFFDGNEYLPFPISASGWETSIDGKQPQPVLSLSNVTQYLASYVDQYGDLVGAKVTRMLTLAKYLQPATFARKNLLNYSESIDTTTSGWTKVLTAVSANAIAAPDGSLTADKMTENSATTPGSPYFYVTQTVSSVTGTQFTFSTYLKAAERTYANIRFDDGAGVNVAQASINLSDGTVAVSTVGGTVTAVSAEAVDCSNGWYRLVLSATWSSISTVRCFIRPSIGMNFTTDLGHLGVIGSGIYVWGSQLETGGLATIYQPTNTGVQPFAASEVFASHQFIVNQMTALAKSSTGSVIEFKLSSLIDRPGKKFPQSQVLRSEFPGVGLLRKS